MTKLTDRISRRDLGLTGLGVAGMGLSTAATVTPVAAAAASKASPRLGLEDRAHITDLFSRYLWAYDCNDEQEFIDLFTDDAIVVGRGTNYRSKEAILGWFRYLIAIREHEGDDTWMHEAGQFRFVPVRGGCLVYAYATHFNGNTARATRGVRSLGYFTCECVHSGGEWRFRRFSISGWDRNTVPWKKPLPWVGADKVS